ncbi:uncharacterized protein DEA37_0004949 [Paragonimus westermani]|uniref:Uncharacterized protein n=1 Tax=Paragonimus westermani TaxID=34504 RepID=A0A5J4P2F1_9TREM|nr:uncharacterized protein DEA37_0004949 [Paragonimus westermani]
MCIHETYGQRKLKLRRIMQLASEAALAVPAETDTTTTQPTMEPLKSNITRLSLQNIFNFVHQNGAPTTSSFAPTKSVRTLARYLDMCLMRQRELRLARLLVNISLEDHSVSPLTSPTTVPRATPLITVRQYNRSVHCCKQFVENHLGPDGVFILRLIAQNYGDLVAGDAVGELWNAYWQKRTGGTGDKTGSEKGQDLGFTEYRRQTSGQAVKPPGPLRVRPSSRSRQTLTATPLTGDSSVHTLSHKEQRRKHLLQTGYSATMMATEMIHPSDRFAVPLLTSTRKPPSLRSHDSSRYSRDSRDRDKSESPPPIPQRSSDGGEYSLSDRRSVQNYGGRSDSQSSSVNRPLTPTREVDTSTREYMMENVPDITGHRESDVDREVREAFGVDRSTEDDGEYNVYKDNYVEEYQPDDNIV